MAKESKVLKKQFRASLLALIGAMVTACTVTFAWYIYNTNARTTTVQMAAGSTSSLLISKSYDGDYGYSVLLKSYDRGLTPISTDKIKNGFWNAAGSTLATPTKIYKFERAKDTAYYLDTVYLKVSDEAMDVYLSDIGFPDNSKEYNPITSAIRVGLVVYDRYDPKDETKSSLGDEYIFEISDRKNQSREYNTATGEPGYVVDSTKADGSTIKFTPLTKDNYCKVDAETGEITVTSASQKICTCPADGTPKRVDIYVWLEGCDEDCVNAIMSSVSNISLEFAGVR